MKQLKPNPLHQLKSFGQSVWLDMLGRELIDSGELRHLVEVDGISGVTSNPAIFEKAINGSAMYDDAIAQLAARGKDTADILRELVLRDIRDAADLLRPVYEASEGADGFVSLEVAPELAHDAAATLAEARELWRLLARPNVMIKVPGTEAGIDPVRQLTREGINVNITLLFSPARYRSVQEAWLEGLEQRLGDGERIDHVASVASFFLSRIDTLVDERLAGLGGEADELRGQAAIASARAAYRIFRELRHGERFARLAAHGARPQRLLWASTSTKNPAYPDTKYVESLIGAETVNTMPMETIIAWRDHGRAADSLALGLDEAEAILARLGRLGIDMEEVEARLEEEGVRKFIEPQEKLFESLDRKRRAILERSSA